VISICFLSFVNGGNFFSLGVPNSCIFIELCIASFGWRLKVPLHFFAYGTWSFCDFLPMTTKFPRQAMMLYHYIKVHCSVINIWLYLNPFDEQPNKCYILVDEVLSNIQVEWIWPFIHGPHGNDLGWNIM
jgi:hypothetical protein